MIETQQSILISAPIDNIWDYVSDIRRWADLMPGCKDCVIINDQESRWVIKVGVGALVRTVNVLVHIDEWLGPDRVNFSYQLEGDPVQGSGAYIASRITDNETDVGLLVRVEGSGAMAPMWEGLCRPLLPQLAKTFAGRLKVEIEKSANATEVADASEVKKKGLSSLWRSGGSKDRKAEPQP